MIEEITSLGFSFLEAKELLKVSKNIDTDIEKLKSGYPIQYLIGYVNFYGNKILVNENVLIPRYETEFLVEKVINLYKMVFGKKNVSICDLCSGSGSIGISLKKEIELSTVTCIDISYKANELCIQNALNNGVNIDVIENDLLKGIKSKFDIIVSNPPYIGYDEEIMPSVKKYEPSIALFAKNNGLYYYEEIIKNASLNLNKKNIIAFEIGYKQGSELIKLSKKYFNRAAIFIKKDLSDKDRYLFIINE